MHPPIVRCKRISALTLFWLALTLIAGRLTFTTTAQPSVQAWVQRYGAYASGANDQGKMVVTDSSGNVIVVGISEGAYTGTNIFTVKYSNSGVPLWTNIYNGATNGNDQANAVAVDSNGNVFITGYTSLGGGWHDCLTIKYSSAGTPLWTNYYHRFGLDEGKAIATDNTGNVVIAGDSVENSYDYTIVKYSNAGVPLWTNRYDGPSHMSDYVTGLAVDKSGNVFVTGYSAGVDPGNYEYATVAYASLGTPLWTNRHGFPSESSEPYALATDGSGHVFVTGTLHFDYVTICYTIGGQALWTNTYNGTGNATDVALAAGADSAGNLFVTGYSYGTSTYDYSTVKYSNSGLPVWTNRYGRVASSSDYGNLLVVDKNDDVIVSGTSPAPNGSQDYLTIKYSNAGLALWTNRYEGPGLKSDFPNSLAVDNVGNVFVTGYSPGTNTGNDCATIAYSSTGLPLWTNRYDSLLHAMNQPAAVAVDNAGNVFVTGSSTDAGNSDFITIKYSKVGMPLWTNRLSTTTTTSDKAVAIGVDTNGDVFITGGATQSGLYGYLTLKYSAAGVLVWSNFFSANLGNTPTALVVDNSGDVLVTGYSIRNPSLPTLADYVTLKYSNAGVPVWTNNYRSTATANDRPVALAVDITGNVLVTGNSPGVSNITDFATVKYSSDGVPLWTNRYDRPGNSADLVAGIAVDTNGNAFVTGQTKGTNTDYYFATIAYSASGVPIWTNLYGSGSKSDVAAAIITDISGNVFVTGTSYTNGGGGNYSYTTIKYANNGVPIWTNHWSERTSYSRALNVDYDGNVIVTGTSTDTNGINDIATIVYSNAGVPLSTNRYNGPANHDDQPITKGIAVTPDGFFVVGYSDGDYSSGTSYDWAIVKYINGVKLSAMITSNVFEVSWPPAFTGWYLQMQTNSTGLGTNWTLVAGSDATNRMSLPAQRKGTGFFRLRSP